MSKGVAVVACVAGAVLWSVFVRGEAAEEGAPAESAVIEIELLEEAADRDAIPADLTEARLDDSESQAVERILRQRCRFRIRNARISDVLAEFERKLGVPFAVEKEALADEGVDLKNLALISMSARGLPAMRAIRRMLSRPQLDLFVEGGEVMISTQVRCGERLQLRQYPVADLVVARLWNGIELQQLELRDLLLSTVEPDSWEDVGGPGSLKYEATGMSLLIRQSPPVHEEIEGALRMLREERRRLPRLLKAAQAPTLDEINRAEASDRHASLELAKIEQELRKLYEADAGNPLPGMGGMGGFFDVPEEGEGEWEIVSGQGPVREHHFVIACGFGGVPGRNPAFGPSAEARRLAFRAMHLALRFEGVIPEDADDGE
jgi:hypothetical protein